jgi:hypothetical protein
MEVTSSLYRKLKPDMRSALGQTGKIVHAASIQALAHPEMMLGALATWLMHTALIIAADHKLTLNIVDVTMF